MKKVLLIGGSPMVGKTTLALNIASSEKVSCISTDDIVRIIDDAKGRTGTSAKNFREYYEKNTIEKLISDTEESHRIAEPILINLINNHSIWGDPIVIEGWALYPRILSKINQENVDSIFFVATPDLLKSRMEKSRYYANASELVKEQYLKRSLWHNAVIKSECEHYGFVYYRVTTENFDLVQHCANNGELNH